MTDQPTPQTDALAALRRHVEENGSFDWLGTGSSSRAAAAEERDFWREFDRLLAQARTEALSDIARRIDEAHAFGYREGVRAAQAHTEALDVDALARVVQEMREAQAWPDDGYWHDATYRIRLGDAEQAVAEAIAREYAAILAERNR